MLDRCTKQLAAAFGATALVIVASISVSSWLTGAVGRDGLSEEVKFLQRKVHCTKCIQDARIDENCEKCSQWPAESPHNKLPSRCLEQPEFEKSLEKMVREQNRVEDGKLRQELKANERASLMSALAAMYQSSRLIVHWFPVGTQTNNSGVIHDYERHRSTYTVSPGPKGSYHDERLVVTSAGLHYVYAKLTFECTKADQKMKHIEIKVLLEDPTKEERSVVLSERVKAKCKLKGDLETLFQRGTFHFTMNSMLTLAYKASDHVEVSYTRDQAYKSCLGMYKVGR